MLRITKKIAIAASLGAYCIGPIDAYGTEKIIDNLNEESNQQLALTNPIGSHPEIIIPDDIWKRLFKEISREENPRHLTSVCKHLYHILRENEIPQIQKELHYSDMNMFMRECMQTYWESRFYKGVLSYTSPDGGKVELKFSDLKKTNGTFDLSACGDTANYLLISTNRDHFFTIEEENKHKTVILITPRYLIEQGINNSTTHPLVPVIAGWDADKAPVGMFFWQWANSKKLTWFDYLTTESMASISSRDLFDNWSRARLAWCTMCPRDGGRGGARLSFTVSF